MQITATTMNSPLDEEYWFPSRKFLGKGPNRFRNRLEPPYSGDNGGLPGTYLPCLAFRGL